jgi:hypothetical protein
MAAALEVFLNRDVSPHWGGEAVVRFSRDPEETWEGATVVRVVDDLPSDVPTGTVAYHDRDGKALPFAIVFRPMCTSLLAGAASVSVACSHEMGEIVADPFGNFLATDPLGRQAWIEPWDPTESDVYDVEGVAVGNFVLRSYFASGNDGPYDFLGTCGDPRIVAPFTPNAGGYQGMQAMAAKAAMRWPHLATPHAHMGDHVAWIEGHLHEHAGDLKRARWAHWASRAYRRGLRL